MTHPRVQGVMKAVVGWHELRPADPTTPEIIKSLAGQLSTESVIYLCSILQMFLGSIRGPSWDQRREQQIALATELLPSPLADEVIHRLRNGTADVVFYEEQLLLSARLATAFGQPGPRSQWSQRAGAEFLLRVTDCLSAIPEDDDSILRLVLRRLGAFPHEQERYLLPRYFNLLVSRARDIAGNPSPIDVAFQAQTGTSIETYLALGFAYAGLFTGIRTVKDLHDLQFDAIVAGIEERLSGSQPASAVRTALTADRDWYLKEPFPADRLQDLALANFMPFYDKPFFRLGGGSALPISLTLALQRLSIGIYWTAFTWRRRHPHGVVDLNAFLGEVFQQYVTEALQSAYQSTSTSTLVVEKDFRDSNPYAPRPDAIVVDGSKWVVMEVTCSSIAMQTLLNGDVERFRAEIRDDKLRRKFEQPILGAVSILLQEIVSEKLDVTQVTDIFPVLILLHEFPQFFNTWAEIDQVYRVPPEIRTKDGRTVRVHGLQMITAEELEMLEPGIGMGGKLADTLGQKEVADPGRIMSMKNFILSSGIAREHDNPRMHALFDAMVDICRPILSSALDG